MHDDGGGDERMRRYVQCFSGDTTVVHGNASVVERNVAQFVCTSFII